MGPEEEFAKQKPEAPIEIRIYPGADGDFALYEDEGDSYNYEKGKYATIPLHWSDANRTLTIGERKGSFPGMIENRTFNVVIVGPDHGVGVEPVSPPDKAVQYSGKEVSVSAK
jgi:alpha-D-xyloside xylohydrolase